MRALEESVTTEKNEKAPWSWVNRKILQLSFKTPLKMGCVQAVRASATIKNYGWKSQKHQLPTLKGC